MSSLPGRHYAEFSSLGYSACVGSAALSDIDVMLFKLFIEWRQLGAAAMSSGELYVRLEALWGCGSCVSRD
jgi:hypothetical protein